MIDDRTPYAIASRTALLVRGFYPVVQSDEWWNLSTVHVTGVVMKETGGQLDPSVVREFFKQMVQDMGLTALP